MKRHSISTEKGHVTISDEKELSYIKGKGPTVSDEKVYHIKENGLLY